MPHLAGAPCGVCQQLLLGLRDGAFCPVCESPVHIECARVASPETPPTICRRCGALKELAKRWREREDACDREQVQEQQTQENAAVARWSLSMMFGEYAILPAMAMLGVVLIPYMLFRRLRYGEDKTPSHLDPTPRPASPGKGAWRKEVDPPN